MKYFIVALVGSLGAIFAAPFVFTFSQWCNTKWKEMVADVDAVNEVKTDQDISNSSAGEDKNDK
jgi:hypothetical protein